MPHSSGKPLSRVHHREERRSGSLGQVGHQAWWPESRMCDLVDWCKRGPMKGQDAGMPGQTFGQRREEDTASPRCFAANLLLPYCLTELSRCLLAGVC